MDGKLHIFDEIRKKFVHLNPEEWVRQHVVHYLFLQGFPKGLIQVEKQIEYHQLKKRFDIVVFDREQNPFLIVECKASDVRIDERVAEQISRYNFTLKAPYLMLTNGLCHHLYQADWQMMSIEVIDQLPSFEN